MKKTTILTLVVVAIFVFGTRDLTAQVSDMDLYVNLGLTSNDKFEFDPLIWTAGVNIDIHLSRLLMFSPECDVVFLKFKFNKMWLSPGAILNVRYGLFFAGAGIIKWFKLVGNVVNSEFSMKMNAGFIGQKYRLVGYIATPFNDFFGKNMIMFGASLGFKF